MVLQSDTKDEVARITRVIEKAYGSLNDPSLDFIRDRLAAEPYDKLLMELGTKFEVQSFSHQGIDVALKVHLLRRPWEIHLNLSLVGRYAVLCRCTQKWPSKQWVARDILWHESQTRSNKEAFVMATLRKHGIETPSPEALYTRIPFRLEKFDIYDYTIYHCLFDVASPFIEEELAQLAEEEERNQPH